MRGSFVKSLAGLCVVACHAELAAPANAAPNARSASALPSALRASSVAAPPSAVPASPASPASVSAPLPAASALAAPPAGAVIGTSGPLLVRRAAASGSWLAFCQPRFDTDGNDRVELTLGPRGELRGDTLGSFLWHAAGERNEGVLLAAASGDRFLAYWKDGVASVIEPESDRRSTLSDADVRFSAETLDHVRTLAFDPSGTRLVYLRRGSLPARLVVRNLADGSERALDPGPAEVWRARFDASGGFLIVDLLSDTNHSGKIEPPAPPLSAPPACTVTGTSYHAWLGRGDRPERVWLDLETGRLEATQTIVLALAKKTLLVRDANGALALLQGGKQKPLEPAECKGRVVHADLERSLLVIGCAQKKKTGRVNLELVDVNGNKQPLGAELAAVESDREASSGARLVALYPGADTWLLDLDKRAVLPLKPGDAVLASHGAHALVRRGQTLVLYDAAVHAEQALPGSVDKFPELLHTGPFVFVSPLLVNVATGIVVGSSAERPLALSATGELLLSASGKSAGSVAEGPLRWSSLSAPSPPALPAQSPP